MDQFNKETAQALISQGNLKEVFRAQLEKTVSSLLQAELTAILGYDPYDRGGFQQREFQEWTVLSPNNF